MNVVERAREGCYVRNAAEEAVPFTSLRKEVKAGSEGSRKFALRNEEISGGHIECVSVFDSGSGGREGIADREEC